MSSWIYSYLFVICAIGYIQKCHSHYDYYTRNRYRFYLYAMDRELIRDTLQKYKSVQFMKGYYSRSPSYHLAERMFNIRKKFARMWRVYLDAYNVVGSNTKDKKHFFLQNHMVKMQRISMDIDHLVEVLTEWEDNGSKNLVNVAGFKIPLNSLNFGAGNFPVIPGASLGGFDTPPGVSKHGNIPIPGGVLGPGSAPGSPGVSSPGGAPGPGSAPGSPGVSSPGGAPGPGSAPGSMGVSGLGGGPGPGIAPGSGGGSGPGGAPGLGGAAAPSSGGGPGGAPAPSGPARAKSSLRRYGKFG